MKPKYYTSCSDLPIFNFYQILDDGKFEYMVKKYKEGQDFDPIVAGSNFQNILEEYTELTSNRKALQNIRMQIRIQQYEYERGILQSTIDLYAEHKEEILFEVFEEFGYKKSEKESIDNYLKRIISRVKSLNNKIRIEKEKYSQKFKKAEKEIKRNLDEEALILEMNLKLGREIDVKKTSVKKWVTLVNISKQKSEELTKIQNNG